MRRKYKLAIHDGKPVITIPHPHFKWPLLGKREKMAVIRQMEINEISIYGRSGIIQEFEDNFAKYHNIKYALATSSGTAALHSAFFGIGIGPGDEVLAPTYTFHSTVTPIFHLQGIPILCDCEPETGNIDPEEINKKITERTKAIIITHMWGHPVELDPIVKIAKKNKLYLIEDCSHALGATYKGQKVGTFGDAACFSLQANKMLVAGEGGILITNNREIYERATLLGHYRKRAEECVKSKFYKLFTETGYGLKYRIHPLGAAIANTQLKYLDKIIKQRTDNLNYFSKKLIGIKGIRPPITRKYVTRGSYYGYKPFFVPKELEDIPMSLYIEALQAEGMEIHKPGSNPLHLLSLFQIADIKLYRSKRKKFISYLHRPLYKKGDLPQSEIFYNKILSLPTFTQPSKHIIDQYILAFKKVAEGIQELIPLVKQFKS